MYASLVTDEKFVVQVRLGTVDEFMEDVLHAFRREALRRHYLFEREHPELVDLGGES